MKNRKYNFYMKYTRATNTFFCQRTLLEKTFARILLGNLVFNKNYYIRFICSILVFVLYFFIKNAQAIQLYCSTEMPAQPTLISASRCHPSQKRRRFVSNASLTIQFYTKRRRRRQLLRFLRIVE